ATAFCSLLNRCGKISRSDFLLRLLAFLVPASLPLPLLGLHLFPLLDGLRQGDPLRDGERLVVLVGVALGRQRVVQVDDLGRSPRARDAGRPGRPWPGPLHFEATTPFANRSATPL